MSRRISLSPFPSLRHHSGHYYSVPAFYNVLHHSITFSVTPSTPQSPSHPSLPTPATPFLSVISSFPSLLRFSPFHSPFLSVSRFYSSPSLPVSCLPVSIHFPSPRLYPFPVSIRFPSLSVSRLYPFLTASARPVSWTVSCLTSYQLPITGRCCLAIIPCYSVTFPYIKPYTMVVRPQFVID